MQVGERLLQCIGSDPVDVKVHPFVERLVQVASYVVCACFVQLLGVRDEFQRLFQHLHAYGQFSSRRCQLFLDTRTGDSDLPEPCPDLLLRHCIVRRQIHQAFLLGLQLLEALLQCSVHLSNTGGLVREGFV
ncbi:hypothetical protein [Nocardia brasiliensis]|uniref:hypothetical protein n=1 Tax=Nocardia brasiliensis TaxID=37326 RepID=UPI002457A550|nr:hypothetical protein [Nocardia brasiliensis]